MPYRLSYVFALPTDDRDHPPMGMRVPKVYGESLSHPSIIVESLPYLKAIRLPRMKRSGNLWYNKKVLDPAPNGEIYADHWEFSEYYTIWADSKSNLLHVQDWIELAPDGVAYLDGVLLISMKVLK